MRLFNVNQHRFSRQIAASLLFVFPLWDVMAASHLEERVTRLEQKVDAEQEYNVLGRIDELQNTVAQLQGQVEVQANQINQLTQQQLNLYKDLDARINKLVGDTQDTSEAPEVTSSGQEAPNQESSAYQVTPQTHSDTNSP